MNLHSQIQFTGYAEQRQVLYGQLRFSGCALGQPSGHTIQSQLQLTGIAAVDSVVTAPTIYSQLQLTGVAFPDTLDANIRVYDRKTVVSLPYESYEPTVTYYGSQDGVTYVKIGTATNDTPISTVGYKYYRIAVTAGNTTITRDIPGVYELPSGKPRYWSAVGLKDTDLTPVGIYLSDQSDPESPLIAKFNSGVVYLPSGNAYWMGSGVHYHIAIDSNPAVIKEYDHGLLYPPKYIIPFSAIDSDWAHSFSIDNWPIACYYIENETATYLKEQVSSFLYESVENAVHSLAFMADPSGGTIGASIPVRNWDTGTISPVTPHKARLGINAWFGGLSPGQFGIKWGDTDNPPIDGGFIAIRPLANTPFKSLHICFGSTSLVLSPPLTNILYRLQQPYIIVKDSQHRAGQRRLDRLIAEIPRSEPIRRAVPTAVVTYVLDETGSPLSDVNVTAQYEALSTSGSTDAYGKCILNLTFTTTGQKLIRVVATRTTDGSTQLGRLVRNIYCEVV